MVEDGGRLQRLRDGRIHAGEIEQVNCHLREAKDARAGLWDCQRPLLAMPLLAMPHARMSGLSRLCDGISNCWPLAVCSWHFGLSCLPLGRCEGRILRWASSARVDQPVALSASIKSCAEDHYARIQGIQSIAMKRDMRTNHDR